MLTAAPGDEPVTGSDLLGRELSPEEAKKMSAFWEENIRAVLGLFRDELAHIEAGTYKARRKRDTKKRKSDTGCDAVP